LYKVAVLMESDPALAPVFERLESELEQARQSAGGQSAAQHRAAALLAQRANGSSKAKACSSDAPLP
jgi:hypothetical protein